jgi:hypothetical protein
MLAWIMRLDRLYSLIILLNLLFIIVSASCTNPRVIVTGRAMPNFPYMLKYSIRAYFLISIKISSFQRVLTRVY